MPDKKNESIQFQVIGIEIHEMNLNTPKLVPDSNIFFNFKIFHEHKVDLDNNQVFVIVTVDITGNDKEPKYASMKVSCVFNIAEISKYVDAKTKKHRFPASFVTTLNSISYSTVRGVMFSQFKGTFLHNAILPLIDPSQFKMVPKK